MATITTEQVQSFALRSRKINDLQDKQKEDRTEILEALLKGAEIPEDGPFTIELQQNGGKDFSWEEEYKKLRINQLKAEEYSTKEATALVAQEMKELYDAAPAKEAVTIGDKKYVGGVKLCPKINAKYGRKKKVA